MRVVWALIFLLGPWRQAEARELDLKAPWTSALQLGPMVNYTQASVFGDGSVPAYRGFGYGGEIDYSIGTQELSLGPFVSYKVENLTNTASNSDQKEKLDQSTSAVGLIFYAPVTYLKVGLAHTKIKDRASGTVDNTRNYSSNGLTVGGGINFIFSDSFTMGLGLDVSYFKFGASDNNLVNRLDYLSYAAGLTFRFSVPSISPKER